MMSKLPHAQPVVLERKRGVHQAAEDKDGDEPLPLGHALDHPRILEPRKQVLPHVSRHDGLGQEHADNIADVLPNDTNNGATARTEQEPARRRHFMARTRGRDGAQAARGGWGGLL